MKQRYATLVAGLLLLIGINAFGQQPLVSDAQKIALKALSASAGSRYANTHRQALALAKSKGWFVRRKTKTGGMVSLQGVNSLGFPVYLKTDNNVLAAATTHTNTVQPGGQLGLNLSGSSAILKNKLAIWDGGSVYTLHQEFAGKTITIKDSVATLDHATHVSGTMLAKGVYPPARGMAFNATTLLSYDFDNDITEMSDESANLLLSNHSYGDEAGWNFDDLQNRWEWFGLPGDTVDYNFGFYSERTQAWDKIAHNAPYYLIVESSGNSRASTGPAVGETYYGFDSKTNQTFVNKGPRPANISSNGGYDVISTTGNAKNILTVGAINPLPNGPVNRQGINSAYFSSWGPTDDGRVKPDIVGDGLNVLSTGNANPTSYITLSGTSMAAPNITGSLYLLQEYYASKNANKFMRSATLKGLACHTAFDAGNAGPDYIYGWGVLDMQKAAQAITENGIKSLIKENTLQQGQKQTYNVTASGNGALMATITWTDPESVVTKQGTINSRTPKLVNDLDIRITDGTNTFTPWVLDPARPSAVATTGDNIRDNVEQVYVAGAVPGRNYTVTVSHKKTLTSGSQPYSIIVTGIGGTNYCASAPLSSADSRINNVTLSNINSTPPPGCTAYTDCTGLTVQLEQNKTYPLSITLGTCNANYNKIAKVFIDWNADGVFADSELVATTNVINGTDKYQANITVPATVTAGNYSLMRVVLTETADASAVKACGSYSKGETQDYRVQFLQTGIDVGAVAIISPAAGGNCTGPVPITVTLKNFGSQAAANIPVTVTVTAPDKTVTTFNQTYTASLAPGTQDDFTFISTYNVSPGSAYSITAVTKLHDDLITANDQTTASVVTSDSPVASDLAAARCDNTGSYSLSGTGDGEIFWYKTAADALPFAAGTPAVTTQAPVNNTYYAGLNDFSGNIGPATKNVFTAGGYNQFTPAILVSSKAPVLIESARLYIGNSGKITFNVMNLDGEVISSSTIDAVATRTTPGAGVQPDDPNDRGAVYNLNLLIPAAGNYAIGIGYDATATIYRNNGGVTGYPFTVGNIFSITGNNATSGPDTTYYKSFYYYLYDIHLKSPGCASAVRQAVTVTKPVITQNGKVLSSNFASGNQWYLNGVAVKGATGQTFSPLQSGNYTVDVTLSSGCTAISGKFVYVIAGTAGDKSDIGLSVFPVPATNLLNVLFSAKAAAALKISLISSSGQVIYTSAQALDAGNFSTVINVANVTPGTYVLKLLLGQKVYSSKVIINR